MKRIFSNKSWIYLVAILGSMLLSGGDAVATHVQNFYQFYPECLANTQTCFSTCSSGILNMSDSSSEYVDYAWRGNMRSWDDQIELRITTVGVNGFDYSESVTSPGCTCGNGCASSDNPVPIPVFSGGPSSHQVNMSVTGYQLNNLVTNPVAAKAHFTVKTTVCDPDQKAENGACVKIVGDINLPAAECVEPCNIIVNWDTNSHKKVDIYKDGSILWAGVTSPVGRNTDIGVPRGIYSYCVRGYGGSDVQTADLECGSVTVIPPSPVRKSLMVSKAGTGTGTITSSPPGINCGSDCSESYSDGTSVTLTATAAVGSTFTSWSGDADCTDGIITMNANKNCTATFTIIPQSPKRLDITKAGTGSGTVTSSPGGINCGSDCSEPYAGDTFVTLTATAAAGSIFVSWTGAASDCSDGSVTMNADKNCTVTFDLISGGGGGGGGEPLSSSLSVTQPTNGYITGELWFVDIFDQTIIFRFKMGDIINCGSGGRTQCFYESSSLDFTHQYIVLKAFPDTNHALGSWGTGSCNQNQNKDCSFQFYPGFNYTAGANFIGVALSASPSSGAVPLNNVSLTAFHNANEPYGVNEVRYLFDCTNDGSYERDTGFLAAGGRTSYTANNLCNYASLGTYTAKVLVNWRGFYEISNTTAIGTNIVTVSGVSNFALTVTDSPKTIPSGQTAIFDITATASNSASGAVTNLQVSNLPTNATYSFNPATISTVWGGTTQLSIFTNSSTQTGTKTITICGDNSGVGTRCTTADLTVSNPSRTLTFTRPTNGTVTTTDGRINCGTSTTTCSAIYSDGDSVMLNATPDAGYVFSGWGGDSDCTDGSITMSANKTCNATFTGIQPTASIQSNGSDGPVTIPYNSSATLLWTSGNATSCTASASPSNSNWTGSKATSGSQSTGNITTSTTLTLTCTGPGGSVSDSVRVNVPPPDFGISKESDIFATIIGTYPVTSNSMKIAVNAFDGFNDIVRFSVQSVNPSLSGSVYNFSKTSLKSGEYSTGLNFSVTVPASTPPGLYTITVEGRDGGLVRTLDVRLNVIAKDPSFKEI